MAMAELALRPLGVLDVSVSELCLGTVNFGVETDEQTSREVLDSFLGAGGNVIDTADVYAKGRSEEIVGRALGTRRDNVILATKGGMQFGTDPSSSGSSRRHLMTAVHGSLRRLGTDWLDLYQLHLPDPNARIEETLDVLNDLVHAGKIRYAGVCNYAGWQLSKALGVSDRLGLVRFATLEAQYSLASRDIELDLLPLCRAEGIGVMAWGSLGGGILSGKYRSGVAPEAGTRLAESPESAHPINRRTQPIIEEVLRIAKEVGRSPAQVALKWISGRPCIATAIVSARTAVQITDNLGVAGWDLDPEHLQALERVSRPRLTYPHDLQQMLGCRPPL